MGGDRTPTEPVNSHHHDAENQDRPAPHPIQPPPRPEGSQDKGRAPHEVQDHEKRIRAAKLVAGKGDKK